MSRILGSGKCSWDLVLIDDEDEHLQQERQPADGRGHAGAVRATFPRGRRGRGRRTAADVGPISRERENNSAGAVVRAEFARKPGAPRSKIDANALRARGIRVGVWAQVVRILERLPGKAVLIPAPG